MTTLSIVEAPRAQEVAPGETAVFAVSAQGSGTIGYQWLRNGQPIAGEVRPRLEVRALAEAQGDRYAVRVTDANGSLTTEPVQFVLRAASDWQRWIASSAGPVGTLSDGPDQFAHPFGIDAVAFRFDLYLARPDGTGRASLLRAQGLWDPMVEVRDGVEGLPGRTPRAAGPVRAIAYAANGELWRLDLRVPPGQEPRPQRLSTQLSRQMCRHVKLYQDRVDPMRSLLVYWLPQPDQGCNAPDTSSYRVVRLNHQPFEAPIDLPPRAQPLFALHDAEGTITGLVMREAGGQVLRLDALDFRSEPALARAAGPIETLLQPRPGQPWWVFSDGARILSVRVDAPAPWTAQTLAAAGAAGAALPDVLGRARVNGALAMLLWERPVAPATGGRLLACAVSGCPAGPRELLVGSPRDNTAVRVPDSEDGDRAWLALGDGTPTAVTFRPTVVEVREDGSVSVRLTESADPEQQLQRGIIGLFGDWLLSTTRFATTLGLPVTGTQPERMLIPTGRFLPQREATRVNRFWVDFQSSAGRLELRDAEGEEVRSLTGLFLVQSAVDFQGAGDELLVLRPRAAGGTDLVGLDPLTGAVRTEYGLLPGVLDGSPRFLDPPRTGQAARFTTSSRIGIGRVNLWTIRVGTPGVRLLAGPDS